MTIQLPALPKNLAEYCEARELAIDKLRQAIGIIKDVDGMLGEIGNYVSPREVRYPSLRLEDAVRDIDKGMWRQAFGATGFMAVMDAQALDQFMRDLEKNPPPFTMDNIRSTFISLYQQADEMFARGVVNVFGWLSDKYKTNSRDPFKVDRRAVVSWVFESDWHSGIRVRHGSRARGELNDIDRVFAVLDGKQHDQFRLEAAINAAFHECERGAWIYEDEYFQIRGFLNGNAHILFKRQDLLDKVNQTIGRYYDGQALAERKAA